MSKIDILAEIDTVLGDSDRLTLDVIMDQVFPPGEQRNTPDIIQTSATLPPVGVHVGMVRSYTPGDDPEGERLAGYGETWDRRTMDGVEIRTFSAAGVELMDDLYERDVVRWISRPARVRALESTPPISGETWFSFFRVRGGKPHRCDLAWLAEEAEWLAEHSEP